MRKVKLLVVALSILAGGVPAIAENHPVPVDTSRVVDLDEVVVVSQPKEFYRLRQQPISSTVMSGETLNSLSLIDLHDVSAFVPSFTMPNYGSRFTSSIYVRGIDSRVNSPSMGIYVDDIPLVNKTSFNNR